MTEAGRRSTGRAAPLRVLFVCTANISRSPYAERRSRQAVPDGAVVFTSAGVPGYPGRAMDPEMERLLLERGGSSDGHASRSVSDEIIAGVDLVLPFEFGQHMKLLDAFPDAGAKIIGLGQFAAAASALEAGDGPVVDLEDLRHSVVQAAGPNSMSFDVDDPYQRGAHRHGVRRPDRPAPRRRPAGAGGGGRTHAGGVRPWAAEAVQVALVAELVGG